MTLIDTSAWISFFRDLRPLSDKVVSVLEEGDAALCGPVFTELSRGLRETERTEVMRLLASCEILAQATALWSQAGDLGRHLRTKGVTAKTLDLLIAVYALNHHVPLLAADGDFASMRQVGVLLELI